MAKHKRQEANIKLKDAPQDKQAVIKRTTQLKDEIAEMTTKKQNLEKLITFARKETKGYMSVVGA